MGYKIFVLVSILLLAGCFKFDLSHKAIEKSRATERINLSERVNWTYYDDKLIRFILFDYKGCVLFHVKNELSCPECDLMDQTFKKQRIINLINKDYLPVEVSDDLPDWYKANKLLGIKDTPGLILFNTLNKEILYSSEGKYISEDILFNILTDSAMECKEKE